MGRFSTTVHIKNNVDRMKFVNAFCDVMKKRGFAPCTEDEAAVSYLLAFGEGWVTLANEDYKNDPKKAYEDSQQIAATMKTSAFSVEVVDSDFAVLKLFGGNYSDEVVVGDGSGYGVDASEGDRKLWEPLLAVGKTWEEFSEAAAAQEVFVEDALCKVANVFGIDPYYIDADHDEVSEKADGNKNIVELHFKAVQEKVMSLNAAFNKVFGEGLAEFGFKKLKGKQPYFVRVVPGGEIIQVIAVQKAHSYFHVMKREGFDILSGVATVYRPEIDLSLSPRYHTRWLHSISYTYCRVGDHNFGSDLYKKLCELSYIIDDPISQLEEMRFALEQVKNIVLPEFNKIVDYDTFTRYCIMVHDWLSMECHFEAVRGGELNPNDVYSEGLILFKVKDYPGFVDRLMEQLRIDNSKLAKSENSRYSKEDYEEFCGKIGELKQERISKMNEIKNDTQFYELIERELERRKKMNTKTLRSYGLEL